MATKIQPCPFCFSHRLHIAHHLMSYSVVCETCKGNGPHRRGVAEAVEEWNHVAHQLIHARVMERPLVQGHLTNLEHAVRNLAIALRTEETRRSEFEH